MMLFKGTYLEIDAGSGGLYYVQHQPAGKVAA
jgi:hypothetical protein